MSEYSIEGDITLHTHITSRTSWQLVKYLYKYAVLVETLAD